MPSENGWQSFFQLKLGVTGLLTAGGMVAVAASIGGFAGRYWWFLDLASHFRVQYFITLMVVALALFALRSHRLASVFAITALINLAFILPLYSGPSRVTRPQIEPLRAMLINLYTSNTDHSAVIDSIERYDPDFVIMEEINQ